MQVKFSIHKIQNLVTKRMAMLITAIRMPHIISSETFSTIVSSSNLATQSFERKNKFSVVAHGFYNSSMSNGKRFS